MHGHQVAHPPEQPVRAADDQPEEQHDEIARIDQADAVAEQVAVMVTAGHVPIAKAAVVRTRWQSSGAACALGSVGTRRRIHRVRCAVEERHVYQHLREYRMSNIHVDNTEMLIDNQQRQHGRRDERLKKQIVDGDVDRPGYALQQLRLGEHR